MSDSQQVFRLRKAGDFDEALTLARQLIKLDPEDVWNQRAFAWSLHSLIWQAIDNDELDRAKKLHEEFLEIPLLKDDEAYQQAKASFSRRLDPRSSQLENARTASKAGDKPKALKLLRQIVKEYPDWNDAQYALGWEIEHLLRELVHEDPPPLNKIEPLLREYARLNHVPRPDKLHSIILSHVTRISENYQAFIEFVKWWDLENLQDDDYRPYIRPDKDPYPSLVERLIKAIHKSLKNRDHPEDIPWVLGFVEANYSRYPDEEWFPFYYGKLLIKADRLDDARNVLLPIVRAKKTESWAWHSLADTYSDDFSAQRKACLCRALLCKTEDRFLGNIRLNLADMLVKEEAHEAAKYEYESVIGVKQEKGYKIPTELTAITQNDWYINSDAAEDNTSLYMEFAPNADQLLTESLPWWDGVVTHRQKGRDGKPDRLFLGFMHSGVLEEAPVREKDYPAITGVAVGQPVLLKWDRMGDRNAIVTVGEREGEPWDIIPVQNAVIAHVNNKKGVSKAVFDTRSFCLIHHDRFPGIEGVEQGSFVEVRVRYDSKREIYHALNFNEVDEGPDQRICRVESGTVRHNVGQSFGFMNDCYISKDLMEQWELDDGYEIEGIAVCEYHSKKMKDSWSLAKVTRVFSRSGE